jgi:hypothetical protein
VALALAILPLGGRKNPLQKAISVAEDRFPDAPNLGQVNSRADQHPDARLSRTNLPDLGARHMNLPVKRLENAPA